MKRLSLITSIEVCKIFGISKRTLFRWEKEGLVTSSREEISKTRVYSKKDVEESAEIISLLKQEKEHLVLLPKIRDEFDLYMSALDVNSTGSVQYLDMDKVGEVIAKEKAWVETHNVIINQLSKYPTVKLKKLMKLDS